MLQKGHSMTTEQLQELHEKTLKVLNTKGYIENYSDSIGISKEDLEKNLVVIEADLEVFMSELTPKRKIWDSVVFTASGENNPIVVGMQGMNEDYLSVPFYDDNRRINVRVSIEEI